jgi:hypothetical protein
MKGRYIAKGGRYREAELTRRLNFFFREHNEVVPHGALRGATPKEKYFSVWTEDNENEIKGAHRLALQERRARNREATCSFCPFR